MPVIEIRREDLVGLSGLDRSDDWFESVIPMIGASYEGSENGRLRFEFFPNRPDHYSVEGIARSLRHLYAGSPPEDYGVGYSGLMIEVDKSIKAVRPVMVCAAVKGIHMTQALMESIIDFQEKLHLTVGRKRRKVSIGLHDLDSVTPPFSYRAYRPDEISFVPLGKTVEMTPAEIVSGHEKGKEYGHILGSGPYPVITDSAGNVLSMPPVINGNVSAITLDTENIFIDVSGTVRGTCAAVLRILCAALADRGGRIESVRIREGDAEFAEPDMAYRPMAIAKGYVNRMIGVEMKAEEIQQHLLGMGYRASLAGDGITAWIPPYRMDVLHAVDIVEDIAIAHGYDRFGKRMPFCQSVGSLLPVTEFSELVFEAMNGYGYTQVLTFVLSSRKMQTEMMSMEEGETVVLLNPVSEDTEILRRSLLPGLMRLLEANRHNELPQKVYEIGEVHLPERRKHLAGVSIHPRATFSEVKSVVDALSRDLRLDLRYEESADSRFISGRQATVSGRYGITGHLGEIYPGTITNFNLSNPVVGFEIDITDIKVLR
ncbi:MAG: phenylalanine--tRNA ligase subunit beta [Thermoplasmata archaeon]|uniref:Phenylalanine--tRNA ligase beta subunit n=1 Tax=Candidatus Sysuiplasma superficiale TaxID=2823368 RepID=A0A8J7YIK9_9ARCH|nr:phenylalanine--tRNA ligase subunit beta [Candidatus Sysuiplasma superficiale]MBX8643243.1 phenylalanine--tRNA ligase subunit beta [Candidatus Sysuiplasma superficiale]MCL4346988.1 phenylalanine--tRNA ligase subunit beta [Candidatus Thermoplasmatota archaeon]